MSGWGLQVNEKSLYSVPAMVALLVASQLYSVNPARTGR